MGKVDVENVVSNLNLSAECNGNKYAYKILKVGSLTAIQMFYKNQFVSQFLVEENYTELNIKEHFNAIENAIGTAVRIESYRHDEDLSKMTEEEFHEMKIRDEALKF